MALKLRLARGGTKKRPFYHIVVADVRSPRDGRFIEKLGTYNPLRIAFHEWLAIADDMRKAGNWRDAMMFLLAPPGWSPDGSRSTSREILERWEARRRQGGPAE